MQHTAGNLCADERTLISLYSSKDTNGNTQELPIVGRIWYTITVNTKTRQRQHVATPPTQTGSLLNMDMAAVGSTRDHVREEVLAGSNTTVHKGIKETLSDDGKRTPTQSTTFGEPETSPFGSPSGARRGKKSNGEVRSSHL